MIAQRDIKIVYTEYAGYYCTGTPPWTHDIFNALQFSADEYSDDDILNMFSELSRDKIRIINLVLTLKSRKDE